MLTPDQEDSFMIENLYKIYKNNYCADVHDEFIYFHKVKAAAKVLLSFYLPSVEYEALIGNQDEL